MATLVDGKLTDAVPCHDRGLAYGDGLFETLALVEGSPRHLPRHRQGNGGADEPGHDDQRIIGRPD